MPNSTCYQTTTLEIIPSASIRAFIICLYTITSLFSLVGNVIVLIVQFFGHESAMNIRKYLINLAVSDLIIGVLCIPFTYHSSINRYWPFPHWLCPTAQYVQLLGVFVTSVTLTIIGIERYFFALHPLSRLHSHWLQNHGHIFLLITWALGAIYAYIPMQYTSMRQFRRSNITYYQCSYFDNDHLTIEQRRLFMISNLMLTFAIPCLTLAFSYISIIRKLLWDQKKILNSMNSRNEVVFSSSGSSGTSGTKHVQIHLPSPSVNRIIKRKLNYINSRLKTIKIMFTVIVLYCLCWMPIKIYQFAAEFDFIHFCSKGQFFAIVYTYIFCHWCAMANSMVNPVVYSYMSKSFRNDLRRIFKS